MIVVVLDQTHFPLYLYTCARMIDSSARVMSFDAAIRAGGRTTLKR